MSEPVSIGIGLVLWEYAVKPVIDSAKQEYGDSLKEKLKRSIKTALSKLPFNKDELKVIETEIIKNDDNFLSNKENFLEYINKNTNLNEVLNNLKQREPNINIEKSFNNIKIDGSNNSISF